MNALSDELLSLLELQRTISFAAESEGEGHWITLHNKQSGEGTSHVKIGEGGEITAGPKKLEGKNVKNLDKHPLLDRRTGQPFAGPKKKTATSSGDDPVMKRANEIYAQGKIPLKQAMKLAQQEQKFAQATGKPWPPQPAKPMSAEEMANQLVNDPNALERLTGIKPTKRPTVKQADLGHVFPDVQRPPRRTREQQIDSLMRKRAGSSGGTHDEIIDRELGQLLTDEEKGFDPTADDTPDFLRKGSNVSPNPQQPEQPSPERAGDEAVAEYQPGVEPGEPSGQEPPVSGDRPDGGKGAAAESGPQGNSDVDVSRQFGLFAKDKSGNAAEVGEKAGQANLFNPSKYKTAEKPDEAPDDEAGVKVKTNEMFPATEAGKPFDEVMIPEALPGKERAERAVAASYQKQGQQPTKPEPSEPPKSGIEQRREQISKRMGDIWQKAKAGGAPISWTEAQNRAIREINDARRAGRNISGYREPNREPKQESAAGKPVAADVPPAAEQPAPQGVEGDDGDGGEGGSAPTPSPVQPQPPVPGEGAEEKQGEGKVESGDEQANPNPEKPVHPPGGQGTRESAEPEDGGGGRTPERAEGTDSDRALSEAGGDSAGAGEAEGGGEPQAGAGGDGRSEQEIAQAVNRGEMSVEDVLETHPHLAGDALIEQHKRERDEAQAQAEAEKEAEEANPEGMGDEGAGDVPEFMDGLEEPQETPAQADPFEGTGYKVASFPEDQAATPKPLAPMTRPGQKGKKPSKPVPILQQTLLDNYEREHADQEMQDDDDLADFHSPWTFKRDPKTKSGFPGEVEHFLEGAPRGVKSLFQLTDSATAGQGADAFGKLGDRYFDIAERRGGKTGRLRQAIEAGLKSPDPQVKWAASYYGLDGDKKGKTQKVDVRRQLTGTTGTIKGVPVEITTDEEGHRVLKDGGELPELPLDAVTGPIPFDKGSLKPGKGQYYEKPAETPGDPEPSTPAAASESGSTPENGPKTAGTNPETRAESTEETPSTPTADSEPETPVEASEPPNKAEEQPASPPNEPQPPETVAKDLGDVLLALGTDKRTVDKLVVETMNSEWSGSVDDAIRYAVARYRGERPAGEPKVKKAVPTPAEAPATPQETPTTTDNRRQPPTATPAPTPNPANAVVDQMLTRLGQGKSPRPQGTRPTPGKTPPPTAQTLRQSAKLPQPPSKLPVEPHQPPPAKVKVSKQATSALAAAKPIQVGKQPHIGGGRAPSLPHPPTVHAPRVSTPRVASAASHIHAPKFRPRVPHTGLRSTIGHQPGQTRPVKVHPGRGMSESEIQRAKGRELKELFSADADASLARTLALLELLV